MSKDRPDYINARLSDAALAQLGSDTQVRIVNRRADYVFQGTAAVEVLRFEFTRLLASSVLADGTVMFQEATEVVTPPAAPAVTATPSTGA